MMECPWCPFKGDPRPLHAHLLDQHPDAVRFETRGPRRVYVLECPICHSGYDQAIKPGLDDPDFLREYEREIRLVALDMLVNHLMAEHYGDQMSDSPARGEPGDQPPMSD